ncbi:methyltransferase domain-containing protein [Streptomyces goshikiensis]|uniref:methyltransferase domain-containing protein n=1 Tax=Streptomyces goshikiensis TaxID=1942 RepID=UPI00369D916B
MVSGRKPGPAMLAELHRSLRVVRAMAGVTETIPLVDTSADAVPADNAMHWSDVAVARPEIARVLSPGGILAGPWNVMDDPADRVAGLARISGSAAIGPRDAAINWRAEKAWRRPPEYPDPATGPELLKIESGDWSVPLSGPGNQGGGHSDPDPVPRLVRAVPPWGRGSATALCLWHGGMGREAVHRVRLSARRRTHRGQFAASWMVGTWRMPAPVTGTVAPILSHVERADEYALLVAKLPIIPPPAILSSSGILSMLAPAPT